MKVYINAFLYNNLGDDLFVDVLTNRYPNAKFYTISSFYKNKNIKVYSNKYINKLLKNEFLKKFLIIKKCDAIVSIGGSMYIEGKSKSKINEFKGKDYYILGSNFGPYQTQDYYNTNYDFFKNAKDVCFREKYSFDLFKDLPNVRQAPDILFSLNTEEVKNTYRKRVIISVISCKQKIGKYQEAYENKIIELIKYFKEKDYEVCLMSFCKIEGDEDAIKSIVDKCDVDVQTYYYRGNRQEALNVLADSQIIVGSRFHANILGLVLGKTIIPLSYSKKTNNVLKDIGYTGKIINISDIDKWDINSLTQEDLELKYEVDKHKKDALKHFEVLDEIMGEK